MPYASWCRQRSGKTTPLRRCLRGQLGWAIQDVFVCFGLYVCLCTKNIYMYWMLPPPINSSQRNSLGGTLQMVNKSVQPLLPHHIWKFEIALELPIFLYNDHVATTPRCMPDALCWWCRTKNVAHTIYCTTKWYCWLVLVVLSDMFVASVGILAKTSEPLHQKSKALNPELYELCRKKWAEFRGSWPVISWPVMSACIISLFFKIKQRNIDCPTCLSLGQGPRKSPRGASCGSSTCTAMSSGLVSCAWACGPKIVPGLHDAVDGRQVGCF